MPISILIITSRMNTCVRRGNMDRFREIANLPRRPVITGGNEDKPITVWECALVILGAGLAAFVGYVVVVGVMLL